MLRNSRGTSFTGFHMEKTGSSFHNSQSITQQSNLPLIDTKNQVKRQNTDIARKGPRKRSVSYIRGDSKDSVRSNFGELHDSKLRRGSKGSSKSV
jgi:hypothetical protein